MAQFQAYVKGVEVRGLVMQSTIDGMEGFQRTALKILADVGLDNLILDEDHWYSQEKWLQAFQRISEKVGPSTLFNIGTKIMDNAVLPPFQIVTEALALMDVAYHMNYRDATRKVLYDAATKTLFDGIGHYTYQKGTRPNDATMFCDNPYPCDFDRGIIAAFARRFAPTAKVTHVDSQPCRKRGADACTYYVKW